MLLMPADGFAGQSAIPETVVIKAGSFIAGSDAKQREYGYRLDEKAYGHSITRQQKWYDGERQLQEIELPQYSITRTAITNEQYEVFVRETGHRRPFVSKTTWKSYGLAHPWTRARKYNWKTSKAPAKRKTHPVVLVSHDDASSYARWLSAKTGRKWRLPSEIEWEKAMRGTDGRYFPWGSRFDASRLNSHDLGPFSTTAVGSYPSGESPYKVLGGAGQIYEWTSDKENNNRYIVKGGSWDDKGCGVCRSAARHSRPANLKHILIGFRLVTN